MNVYIINVHIMNIVYVLGRGLSNVFCNVYPIPLRFDVIKYVYSNLALYVCLVNIKVKFETGLLGVKNLVTPTKSRENLVYTQEFTF